MRLVHVVLVGAALHVAGTSALAQFVKGNEAVKVMADGTKRVEAPPLPAATLGNPCPAAKNGCAGGGWKMLESAEGLVECTEVFARNGTCRPSTYGSEMRSRVWIVKAKSGWMQCQLPEISTKCVSLKSLPISAVQ
jgi:hypothetical protein